MNLKTNRWSIDSMALPSRKTVEIKCNGSTIFEMKHNLRAKYYTLKDNDLKKFRETAEYIVNSLNAIPKIETAIETALLYLTKKPNQRPEFSDVLRLLNEARNSIK